MVYATLLRHDEPRQEENRMATMSDIQRKVFDAMDDEFTTKDVLAYTKQFNMPRRTAENMIGVFLTRFRCVTRIKNGLYSKVKPSA